MIAELYRKIRRLFDTYLLNRSPFSRGIVVRNNGVLEHCSAPLCGRFSKHDERSMGFCFTMRLNDNCFKNVIANSITNRRAETGLGHIRLGHYVGLLQKET